VLRAPRRPDDVVARRALRDIDDDATALASTRERRDERMRIGVMVSTMPMLPEITSGSIGWNTM
jgi:hypothetical protein